MNPGCAVCQTSTGGLFMPAKEIVAKLKQQNQLKEQLSKPINNENETNSDEEDDDDHAWLYIFIGIK